MFPEGIPDVYKLAEVIRQVHDKKFPTVQHLATAYGQGDRWTKRVFLAAKEWDLLPHDTTPRQWLDLFPVTRRLTKEEQEDQKRRRAKIREAELDDQRRERQARQVAQANRRETEREERAALRLAQRYEGKEAKGLSQSVVSAWASEDGAYWEPERQFSDLSLDFILSMYRWKDLDDRKKKVVKEKLADRQRGVCQVCRKPFSPDRVPHLDHCHETGRIRGMLCHLCNMGLAVSRIPCLV